MPPTTLTAFDLETTGINPETAHIVTGCVTHISDGPAPQNTSWISDVDGEEIPAEAAAIHGYTTERARNEGQPAAEVVKSIVTALTQVITDGLPIVVMNAPYDFTIIDREARRHGIPTLADTIGDKLRAIDPLVIDRHYDKYRRGPRNLTALCQHYRVPLDDAHNSTADAIAAARVVWRQTRVYQQLSAMSLDDLHTAQIEWAAEQAEGLRNYFARTGKQHRAATVRSEWPLIPTGGTP